LAMGAGSARAREAAQRAQILSSTESKMKQNDSWHEQAFHAKLGRPKWCRRLPPARFGARLFFKTATPRSTSLHSNGPIVWAGFGEGTVAPAMGSVFDVVDVLRKGLMRQGRDVHFLGANVAANVVRFHVK